MRQYRISRNIEASTIQAIEKILTENDWTGITVIKGFAKAYSIKLPVITVRVEDTVHEKVEIGSKSTVRRITVFVDIFAEDDGQRLDLKDTLVKELKGNWNYYEYYVEKQTGRHAQLKSKAKMGRINTVSLTDTPVNFGTDKSNLSIHDRHRHLLTLEVQLNVVEA